MYFVYILASRSRALYVGITSNLPRRIHQHRTGTFGSFTSRYDIHHLVHFEHTTDVRSAIEREKELKSWTRKKKLDLIEEHNPGWRDLAMEMRIVAE
jgi:putative endonuclease